jgi:predicted nucleic acid-binding Zn ribbon protein
MQSIVIWKDSTGTETHGLERKKQMASYEYKCEIDSSTITISRGMTEQEIIPYCDSCNEPMVRVYSAPPVKFNGSGFYSTGG